MTSIRAYSVDHGSYCGVKRVVGERPCDRKMNDDIGNEGSFEFGKIKRKEGTFD